MPSILSETESAERMNRAPGAASCRVLILCPYPQGSAPGQRFRYEQYLQILKEAHIETTIRPFLPEATMAVLYRPGHHLLKIAGVIAGFLRRLATLVEALRYDFIFIFREASPLGPPVFESLLFLSGKRVVYDFDDAIFLPNASKANGLVARLKWHSKVAYIVKHAHKVAVCNRHLVDWASALNPNIVLLPTTIDSSYHKPSRQRGPLRKRPVLGWTGSNSTAQYLELIRPILKELQQRRDFEFRVICDQDPGFPELKNYKFVPWRLETEVEDLEAFDIGLMPVPDGAWEKGKVGFKAIQYSSLEIAPVVSDVGSGSEVVESGKTGLVVKNTPAAWLDALETLLDSPERILQYGKAARERVLKTYSVAAQASNYIGLFDQREGP